MNKTEKTEASVAKFVAALKDEQQKKDSLTLIDLMKSVSGHEPKMWGPSMIGFGNHHYKYESGREGDIFKVGFSPRKPSLVLYSMGLAMSEIQLEKLGKHKQSKGCLYIKRLADVDMKVLKKMLEKVVSSKN